MQRILVSLLIAFALGVSGCSQTGPLSLAQKDASGWSRANLNYIVQQEDLERNLEEADSLRAEKEALAESQDNQSPGILSQIDPIDPAELDRQVRAEREANGEKLIQLVSHTEQEVPDPPPVVSTSASQKPTEPVAHDPAPVQVNNNPLHPKSFTMQAGTVTSRVIINAEPPSQLIGHPLQPLAKNETNGSFVRNLGPEEYADDAMEDMVEVEIKKLPPMILAAPPELPNRPSILAPKPKPEPSVASVEWGSTEQPFDQVQLASWEQEVQKSDQNPQECDEAKQESTEPPKRDEFTNEDFYAAGWCDKPDCKEACVCPKVERIATNIDANLPGNFLPAQFQSEDGPSWELPRLSLELKPLREAPLRVASAVPMLPMEKSIKPTPLPIPIPVNFTPTGDLEIDFSKAPFGFSPTGDLDVAFPVAAEEDMDRTTNAVRNADFRADAKPMPAPKTALTWRQHLESTIDTIRDQVNETVDSNERQQLQSKLDLLRLLPSELDHEQQQYLNALTELLQTTSNPSTVNVYEAGQSLNQLRGAVSYLESVAGMKVVNADFCSKVTGFGQFQLMEDRSFAAGQTVLIYCEIENHSCQPKMVEDQMMSSTRLAGSYIVYDANQEVVQQEKFPVVEDLARKRRRDFYMHLPFVVGDLAPGKYTYQLMVDDVGGGKSASLEPALAFEVK